MWFFQIKYTSVSLASTPKGLCTMALGYTCTYTVFDEQILKTYQLKGNFSSLVINKYKPLSDFKSRSRCVHDYTTGNGTNALLVAIAILFQFSVGLSVNGTVVLSIKYTCNC